MGYDQEDHQDDPKSRTNPRDDRLWPGEETDPITCEIDQDPKCENGCNGYGAKTAVKMASCCISADPKVI